MEAESYAGRPRLRHPLGARNDTGVTGFFIRLCVLGAGNVPACVSDVSGPARPNGGAEVNAHVALRGDRTGRFSTAQHSTVQYNDPM